MKRKIRMISSFFIIFLTIVLPSTLLGKVNSTQETNPGPFFKIFILLPNSLSTARLDRHLEEYLPKIGIEIEHILTDWSNISSRTWGYPGPFPIPTFNEGGYDMLSVDWAWEIEYDPTGLYDSPSISPIGNNFYQYFNPEMDQVMDNYAVAYNDTEKVELVGTIQKLLYEDLQILALYYPMKIYPHKEEFAGWDGLLWDSKYQPMENWSISGQNDFVYATPVDFEDFHPFFAESHNDKQWLNQIYNSLIQRQPGNHFWGSRIASSFTSSDNMNWTIKINPDALWADGTPITAEDVIYSYQLAVNPNIGSFSNYLYNSRWDNDSFVKINDKELRISFKQQSIFQEKNLALQLLPKHLWSGIAPENHSVQALEWMTTNPERIFGAGPYQLAEYNTTENYLLLERNSFFENWTGITPYFETIKFQSFNSKLDALEQLSFGQVDIIDANFRTQMEEIAFADISYLLVKSPGVQEIAINMLHPYLGTGELCPIAGVESAKHIRNAISHCMNREYYVENEMFFGIGTPAATSVPNVAIGFNESYEPFQFNLSKAFEHMLLAGFEYDFGNNSYIIGISPVIVSILMVFVFTICKKRKK